MSEGDAEPECYILACDDPAVREFYNSRAKEWRPACGEHKPMFSAPKPPRPLQTVTYND